MPEQVEECVKSVLEDNPGYSESRAYAICKAQQNKGNLSVGENPSHDELLAALAESEMDCPEGKVNVGDQCVPVEEVEDVPPSSLKNSAPVLQLGSIEDEPIERVELDDSRVKYTSLKILESGVWRDSASKQAIWYSPEGLSNMELTEDNAVNIMHDAGNEVSEAGHMENLREESGSLFADVIIDTSNSAGSYADENMQKTLETEGVKGFGGPSVEIPPESEGGHTTELNAEKGVRELVEGKIEGLGFVSQPASKPTGFDRQASTRGVALSSDQTVMQLEADTPSMATETEIRNELLSRELQVDEIQDDAQNIADELDVPVGDVMEVLDPLLDMDDEEEEEVENEENEEGEGEDNEGEGNEEEEEETEMQGEDMEMIQEQLDDLWGEIEDLKESMMGEEEMSEELSEAKSELADAETVAELEEAKEELDKRLSNLEDEPSNDRSLAEGKSDSWEPVYDDTPSEEASW